ncbi:unnamed protein product [Ectocarpus sp. 4 AP-2014]
MGRFAAAVLGASGQVGGCVVASLLAEPMCTGIVLFNRRKLDKYEGEPRVTQHIVEMDSNIATAAVPLLRDAEVAACFVTMGVGKPSKATREEFEKVDLEIPTAFAQASKSAGCVRHISLLGSVGADATAKPSRLMGTAAGGGFYLGVKGKVENNFEAVGLESAAFFRPSTLIGNANTPSAAAAIHKMVSWALPLRFKEIHIEDVGKAMVRAAVDSLENKGPAVARYEGASLFGLLEDKPAAAAPGSS